MCKKAVVVFFNVLSKYLSVCAEVRYTNLRTMVCVSYGIQTVKSRDACLTLLSGDIWNGEELGAFFMWALLLLLFISEGKYKNKLK
jgi:hypothetical protein